MEEGALYTPGISGVHPPREQAWLSNPRTNPATVGSLSMTTLISTPIPSFPHRLPVCGSRFDSTFPQAVRPLRCQRRPFGWEPARTLAGSGQNLLKYATPCRTVPLLLGPTTGLDPSPCIRFHRRRLRYHPAVPEITGDQFPVHETVCRAPGILSASTPESNTAGRIRLTSID